VSVQPSLQPDLIRTCATRVWTLFTEIIIVMDIKWTRVSGVLLGGDFYI